jgi:predicted regulator of Ras-like GTPase activity (Roadblock/LC7/MglB family)
MTIFESGFESPLNTVTVLHDSEDTAVSNTSIAVGTDGLPVISYSDTASGEFLIAKCATAICTSALISAIDDPGLGHRFDTSIAIGNDGLPVVAYVDQNIGHLKVLKCNDEACAGGDETVTIVDGAESYVAAFPSMAVGLDGLPVISYRDVATGAIKVAKCNDPSCAGGDEQISTLNTTGIYSSIAVAPDGLPVIAYIQGGSSPSTATVRIAKCNDVACEGGDETISEVDVTSVLPGPETSIAMTIGAAGLPVISHYRPLGDEIRFVACNDAACSGADETITTIAYGGGSQQLSIATGADGYPIISYRNGYFGALMVAKCNDLQCSSPTIIMVDHAGDVGWSTSIAIGSDDLPVISYVDAASGALKIVHCGASSCRD